MTRAASTTDHIAAPAPDRASNSVVGLASPGAGHRWRDVGPGDIEIGEVGPASAAAVWHQVAPLVEKGLSRAGDDSTTPELLLAGILSGRLRLWVVHRGEEIVAAVVLQEVRRARAAKVVIVVVAGHDFEAWGRRVSDLAKDLADLVGAAGVEATVRPGMEKWLAELGWKRSAVIMEWREPPSTEASAEGVIPGSSPGTGGAVQRRDDDG